MKTKWKDTPLAQRIVTVFSIVIALSVIVLAVLQILKIWTQAINLCVPLMGVNLLCQTYMQWNTEVNRLCPYIEHLQDRQYDYRKGNDYGHYCDNLMY